MGTVSLPDAKRKKEPKTGSHWFKLSSTPENTRNILYPCTEKPANQWLTGLLGCLNKKDILRKLCGFKGKEAALPLWQLLQPDLPFIY